RDYVPTFPQRSPPSLLTTAACGGLRSAPDCRPRRAFLHLSYSYAAPFGPAILVTQDPERTWLVGWVGPSGLRLTEDAEPVLAGDFAYVLQRCDSIQRRNQIGITARILEDGAASSGHIEPDRNMVGAYRFDDVVHVFRPFVGRRNGRQRLRVFLPLDPCPPTLSKFAIHS